jgi:hypothetical protein
MLIIESAELMFNEIIGLGELVCRTMKIIEMANIKPITRKMIIDA